MLIDHVMSATGTLYFWVGGGESRCDLEDLTTQPVKASLFNEIL